MYDNSLSIIIDTDPGVDDALAIMFAHRANMLAVRGITTVFGNQSIEKTTRNACTVVDIIGAEALIYRGASRPLVKQAFCAESHGETGLGGYWQNGELRNDKPLTQPVENANAVDFLAQTISMGTMIACIGPVTNLAILANLCPDVLRRVQSLIVMGGVFGEPGNTTPWAEFNVYCDPDAFAQLLAFSDVSKVLIPANICRTVTMDEDDFIGIQNQALSSAIKDIVSEYVAYYRGEHVYGGFAGGIMYDTLVIAYILWPELFNTTPRHVVVETGNGSARGATVIDRKRDNEPNCLLACPSNEKPLGVDAQEVKRRLLQLLSG